MPAYLKWLTGWTIALAVGWAAHGPLGRGAAFVDRLQAEAEQVIVEAELSAVEVRIGRDPLRRSALLAGPADAFQREGQGRFPGLNDRVEAVPGISSIRWADEGGAGQRGLPLIAETLLLVSASFLLGACLGALLFRRRREGYL